MAPVVFTSCRTARTAPARACAPKAVYDNRATATATAGFAACVLLAATPALAGVSLEQPKLKNFVTPEVTVEKTLPDPSKRMKRNSKPAQAKAEVPKKAEEASPQLAFNTQSLWPLGVIACGGAVYGAWKIDPGMEDLFANAVKDSSAKGVGIGTEDSLKTKGGYMAPYYAENGSGVGAGTKAIKKKVLPKKK